MFYLCHAWFFFERMFSRQKKLGYLYPTNTYQVCISRTKCYIYGLPFVSQLKNPRLARTPSSGASIRVGRKRWATRAPLIGIKLCISCTACYIYAFLFVS